MTKNGSDIQAADGDQRDPRATAFFDAPEQRLLTRAIAKLAGALWQVGEAKGDYDEWVSQSGAAPPANLFEGGEGDQIEFLITELAGARYFA